jgi:hypothetical protein
MHALLDEPPLYATLHSPNGAPHRFDEEAVKGMVLEWQCDPRPELLNEILLRAEPAITGVLLERSSYLEDLDEVLSLLRIRIWKKLPNYDPVKGRIFTYITIVVHQGLGDIWAKRTKYKEHHIPAGLDFLNHCNGPMAPLDRSETVPMVPPDRGEIYEDIGHRISTVQTTVTDEHELEACRWLVRSFVDSEFAIRRHTCADAMSIVYGIDPARSRVLHDATLLEVRRTLLDVVDIPEVEVADLRGTRAIALGKYASGLSSEDFSRLVFLMRGLAPAIIEAGRIDWILNGYPHARPLFPIIN